MAYGLKYELHCTSKLGNLYKLKLLFDGYEGAEIDRNVPLSPFILKKDKANVICGTSLQFAIKEEVDFELLEFYTNTWKYIKAELYRSTTLIWSGYVAPQQYQAPYVPASRKPSIWFTATDGLGLLKNEEFTLTGNQSQLAIIMHCIDKIGLNLGYSIAIDLYAENQNETYSLLEQTYEDASIYEDLNCYEVLEKMLEKYYTEISQCNGRWRIVCKVDKKSVPKLYTYLGVYESDGSAPAVLNLGYPGASGTDVWPVGSLQMGMQPGGKKVKITHDFGFKGSWLDNFDFTQFLSGDNGSFPSWTKSDASNWIVSQRGIENKKFAFLAGYEELTNTHYIQQSIEVVNTDGDDFVLEFSVTPLGYLKYGYLLTAKGVIDMPVKVLVYMWDGDSTYYYMTMGGWGTSFGNLLDNELMKSSVATPIWHPVYMSHGPLPCSGTLFVRLYQVQATEPEDENIIYNGVAFSGIRLYPLKDNEGLPGKLEIIAAFDNSTEPGTLPEIVVLAADAPDYDNARLLYKNITKLSDGTPTE